MKKLLLTGLIGLFSLNAMAQAVVKIDTVYKELPIGSSNIDLHDTLTNTLANKLPQVWNISNQSNLATGVTVASVCTQPLPTGIGQCVNFSFTPHNEDTIPASGGMDYKVTVNVGTTAVANSVSYVVINSDVANKPMVFAIKAIAFPTSVKNITTLNNVSMYPTPATSILNIVHNSSAVRKAVVHNIIGKRIIAYNTPIGENGFSFPVSDLVNGYYFVELQDKNGNKLAVKKFVKN